MKTFEEYIVAYDKAMKNESDWAKTVLSPSKWIFYKWCDDEGIEKFSDPTLEEKLQKAKAFDEQLGMALEKGIEEISLMWECLVFESKPAPAKRKNKENVSDKSDG